METIKRENYWCFNCNKEVETKLVNDEYQCVKCFSSFLELIESLEDHPSKFKPVKTNQSNNEGVNNSNNNRRINSTNNNNNQQSNRIIITSNSNPFFPNFNNLFIDNNGVRNNNSSINNSNININTNNNNGNGNNVPSYEEFVHHFTSRTLNLVGNIMSNGVIPGLLNQLTYGMESSTAKPPASKSEINSLVKEVITEETKKDFEILECCICKDDYKVNDVVSKIRCGHYHHYECILAWLNKQNNCPVCRFELKTDCLEYENRKARNGNNTGN